MAGNVQLVFFRQKDVKKQSADGSDVLVKFMLNEREVHVDALDTDNFPFYRWPDVENYWTSLLSQPLPEPLVD